MDIINEVYLIIGSNLGYRAANIRQAIFLITDEIGSVIERSSLYETEAWGISDQPLFYNQVLKVQTSLNPQSLLQHILAIEKKMGRVREKKYDARIIDIDILFFNNIILKSANLIIPHPRIGERNFVLAPLAEIAGALVHPENKKNITDLLAESLDKLNVKVVSVQATIQ